MNDIRFACPNCRQHLEAPPEMADEPIECPECKVRITVPSPTPVTIAKPTKRIHHSASLAAPQPQPVSQRIPSRPLNLSQDIIIKRKTIIIAGVVSVAVIGIAASLVAVLMMNERHPAPTPQLVNLEKERTVPLPSVKQEPKLLSTSPSPLKKSPPEIQQQPPLTPSWEQQNRDIIIKMITDGHVYVSDNQSAKAMATYGLLFDLIGTNAIHDVTLRKLLDQAKTERSQIAEAKGALERQQNMLLQGTVTLAKKNGEHVSPPTQVFLAQYDSEDARMMRALVEQFQKVDKANSSVPEVTAHNFETVKAALYRQKEAVQTLINYNAAVCKSAVRGTRTMSTKTDSDGHFMFPELKNGKYFLTAMASIGEQRILWGLIVTKGDAPLSAMLDNDNAQICETGCDWL